MLEEIAGIGADWRIVVVAEEGTAQEEVAQQIGIVDFGERIVDLGLGLMDLREHQIVVGKRWAIDHPIVVAVDLVPVKAQQIGIVMLLAAHCRRLLNPSSSTVGGNHHQLGIVAVAGVGPVGREPGNTIADRQVGRTTAAVPYWNLCLGHKCTNMRPPPINLTWQQN